VPEPRDAAPVDGILQLFVQVMNGAGAQLGFTVLVGGRWVSGTLIPPRMFMEEYGTHVVEKAGEEAMPLRVFFREVGRLSFPSESEAAAGAAPAPPADRAPDHLHLRNARMVSEEGQPIPTDGCYLRVRLSQVAGWVIGEFGPRGYRPPAPPRPAG
jgi:hypothetical protein